MQDSRQSAASTSLARLLTAFTFASDLAFALEFEDGIRSTYVACKIADKLGLTGDDWTNVYYTALLKDAGCTCYTSQFAELFQTPDELVARREGVVFGGARPENAMAWLQQYVGTDMQSLGRAAHLAYVAANAGAAFKDAWESSVEVCSRISERLGMPAAIRDAEMALGEQWDGGGFPGRLKGDEIPLITQIITPTFIWPPVRNRFGREAAVALAREQRGNAFSPVVCDAFIDLAQDEAFWEVLESPEIVDIVIGMEPDGPLAVVDEQRFDALADAFADFIDLKSPYFAAHSRRVAKVAEQIARLMHCPEDEVKQIRRAALMHDLGIVGVPSRILNKPEARLSATERDTLRLHSYSTERIVDRVPAFALLKPLMGNHHEHIDGSGYFRGLKGRDIPFGARVIAVANRLDELTHEVPEAPGISLAEALNVIAAEAGTQLDSEIVDVVRKNLGEKLLPQAPRAWPAGLSDREIEVLRLASKGLTRKQVADELGITENTVRHHLEHIYGKTGTTTRVGATLFAMENNLLI
jgi:HD-GYP domain-containing protein (c-di-GMP phosphodiesterase class II)